MNERAEQGPIREFPKFSLVRHHSMGVGRVLRTDSYGVFVEWDDGAHYVGAWDLAPVGGVVAQYVADLVAIIRWLHPDESVDPRSYAAVHRELGGRVAVLLNDIILGRTLVRVPDYAPHFTVEGFAAALERMAQRDGDDNPDDGTVGPGAE